MDDILFKIIELVIIILMALIGRYVVPYLKSIVDINKLEQIVMWANKFVVMAENVITGKGKGTEKCEYVSELLIKKAKELGLQLTDEQIRTLVEDAYNTMIKTINADKGE